MTDFRTQPVHRGAWSWALMEGTRNPYSILIVVYVFMPYFATVMVPDPVEGQLLVASYGKISGWIVAFTAPILGAAIDYSGRRKPGLAATTLLMAPLIFSLWWAKPDGTGISIATVILVAILVQVLFAYNEVLHNSMLERAAGPVGPARVSALGLGLGSLSSVVMLVFVLWAFALPGQTDWSFIPETPLFGLDPATSEPQRIVGPIVGVTMILGLLPLLLYTEDHPRIKVSPLAAVRSGVMELVGMAREVKKYRDPAIFILGRMFYTDGKVSVMFFGGVYAAGTMQWGGLEMLGYGVVLTAFAVFGGFAAGWFDSLVGPKRAVQWELAVTLIALAGWLGTDPNTILYTWPADQIAPQLWDGPMFTTLPEIIFISFGCVIAITITAAFASSRTLMTRLAPPEKSGAFFGLYALAGTVTAWLGPMLVELFTGYFDSQRAGFIPIAGLILAGLLTLSAVRGGMRA